MSNSRFTTWITLRLSTQQKAKLLNMASKAGDPNPSVTIVRKLFGRSAAMDRQRGRRIQADSRRQRKLFPTKRLIAH